MADRIYVFCGTGNSFAVGRALGERLGFPVELICQPLEARSAGRGYSVGIVFPVYHGTAPRIVWRRCAALETRGAKVWSEGYHDDTSGAALADVAAMVPTGLDPVSAGDGRKRALPSPKDHTARNDDRQEGLTLAMQHVNMQ